MPKGHPLSDSQKRAIYEAFTLNGERQKDIADTYGIRPQTVSKIIGEMRKVAEDVGHREKIVAGNKRTGRLVSCQDPNRFEGSCVINGKANTKTFTALNPHMAEKAWEKWCQELRDEQAFMDMVERKAPEEVAPDEEPKVVCGFPGDPIEEIKPVAEVPAPEIDVRPWKEVAEERQQRIEELEKRIEYLEGRIEGYENIKCNVIADTEGETPKLSHWFNNNGSFRVMWMNKPVYVLWAKGETPKVYGTFWSMESALKEVDKLNDVAAFLGSTDAFEVEEVQWRG